MQYKILVASVAVLIFQTYMLADAIPPGPQCVPPSNCKECPAGVVPRVVETGCPGCPECCVPPPCPRIASCPPGYTLQLGFLPNGCEGCYSCVQSA